MQFEALYLLRDWKTMEVSSRAEEAITTKKKRRRLGASGAIECNSMWKPVELPQGLLGYLQGRA